MTAHRTHSLALVACIAVAACGGKTSPTDGEGAHALAAGSTATAAGSSAVTSGGANAESGGASGTVDPGHPNEDDSCSEAKPCGAPLCTTCADGSEACVSATCVDGHCLGSGDSCPIETGDGDGDDGASCEPNGSCVAETPGPNICPLGALFFDNEHACTKGFACCVPTGDIVTQLYPDPSDASCTACLRSMNGVIDIGDGAGSFDCGGVIAGCGAHDESCGFMTTCAEKQLSAGSANLLCAYEACVYECQGCADNQAGAPSERFFYCAQVRCAKPCGLDGDVCPNYD